MRNRGPNRGIGPSNHVERVQFRKTSRNSDQDQPPSPSNALDCLVTRFAANGIKNHVSAVSTCQFTQSFADVRVRCIDDMISSQGTTIVGLRLSPSGRHYPRSQSLSEMYCSRSAGPGPAQDQKRLSFGELASAPQTDMRRVIWHDERSAEHTSELQSLMRNSYPVLVFKKKK